MIKETEIDPLTLVRTKLTYRDDGKVDVVRIQDLSKAVEYARIRRAQEKAVYASKWRKEVFSHYAILPDTVQHEMYKAGINVSRDTKAVIKFINERYPMLKVTNRWHHDARAKKKNPRLVVL